MSTRTDLFDGQTDRYAFDFGLCSTKNGFAQVDTSQDASYFGTWANPHKLQVVSYTEGDICVIKADTPDEFKSELRNIQTWNTENGHKFLGIDLGFDVDLKQAFVDLELSDLLH